MSSNNFLNHDNFSYLINFVFNEIKQKTEQDISSNKKYVSILKKLIQTIYNKNINKKVSTEFLNNLVIDKCIPFIINQLNKDPSLNKTKTKTNKKYNFSNLELINDPSNVTSNVTGISSRDTKIDYSTKMQELENDRSYQGAPKQNEFEKNRIKNNIDEIIGKNSNDEADIDNTDILKKMQELQNERGYQTPTPTIEPFENRNSNSNSNSNIELDSTILSKLYSQNSQNSPANYPYDNDDNDNDNDTNSINNYSSSLNPMKRMEMTISDATNEINNDDEDNGIDDLKNLEKQRFNKENRKEFSQKTLLPTNYIYDRTKKFVLTIDVANNLPNVSQTPTSSIPAIENLSNSFWNNFKVNLVEPLVIDSTYDVYLESITVNNPARASNNSNLNFVIDISEFNIKTNTNNIFMKDKFVIPNENTTGTGDNKIMKYHLKSNYIASINATKLTSLTFKITNEDNETVNITNDNTINTAAAATATVNNVGGYTASTPTGINVNFATLNNIIIGDSLYNNKNQLVGLVTIVDDNPPNIITFGTPPGTLVPLVHNEVLYLSNLKTTTTVNGAVNPGPTITLTVADNTNTFNVDDKVYLGDGQFVGQVSNINGNVLTFTGGVQCIVPDGFSLYSGPSVFNTNSSTNRMIMEFILISR